MVYLLVPKVRVVGIVKSMALTDIQIRKSSPKDKDYKLSDSGGLHLLVKASGSKLWRMAYRFAGKQKTLAFGPYPLLTLAEARERAFLAKKKLLDGVDPGEEKRMAKITKKISASNSFESIAMKWFEYWGKQKSPRHADYVLRRLQVDVFPQIGHRPIGEIKSIEIVGAMKKIEERGALDIAKRNFQTCGQIFRYAITTGFVIDNPVAKIKASDFLMPSSAVNFARIDLPDLPKLLLQMDAYDGSSVTRISLQLMALTFLRTSELIAGRWEEIDFENAVWRIPPHRMKVKMRGEHWVPLSKQAIYHLRALQLLTGQNEFLFPGARDRTKPMSNNTILGALKRMGYLGMMTGHGFRGLASTAFHEANFREKHIEVQLAHLEPNKTAGAYNHAKYIAQRTQMMQWWGDFLDLARQGVVLPLPKLPAGYSD